MWKEKKKQNTELTACTFVINVINYDNNNSTNVKSMAIAVKARLYFYF